jgi:hypothetical protein
VEIEKEWIKASESICQYVIIWMKDKETFTKQESAVLGVDQKN